MKIGMDVGMALGMLGGGGIVPSSLLNGLVAYYKLSDVNDSVGTNHLTNNGTVTFPAGLVGNCASFTPTQSLSHVANPTLQVGDFDFTFDCAVRFTSLSTYRVFASQWVAVGDYSWAIYYGLDTNRIVFSISVNGTTFVNVVSNNFGAPSINTWYYVNVFHDSTNNVIGISINNGTPNTFPITGAPKISNADFTIGNGISLPHAGQVDEFGFWKRLLTPEEKTMRFNGGALSTYPFDVSPELVVIYDSTDINGVKSYNTTSHFNAGGSGVLRILEPTNPVEGVPHRFIYVLPAEPELDSSFGDGLETLRLLDAHNTYNATIICPSFEIASWYANHSTNFNYQYENFMSLELQPWVKSNLGSASEQHWLIGFSKSGFGGIGLLLKHPSKFSLGAFWDFPANMSTYTDYGANTNYGTQANFDANYKLTANFLEKYKAPFVEKNRIWINGYSSFQTHVSDFDTLLSSKLIQHTTAAEVSREHIWNSGWVQVALASLSEQALLI